MTLFTRDGRQVIIPYIGIEALIYRRVPDHSTPFADVYFGDPNSPMSLSVQFFGPYADTAQGVAGLVSAAVIGAVLGAFIDGSGTNHVIDLVWRDGSAEQVISLGFNRENVKPFSVWIESHTGQKVYDANVAATKLQARIEQERAKAFPLKIDREVRMQGLRLKPRNYVALLLEERDHITTLYLFRNKSEPARLAGTLALVSEAASDDVGAPLIEYSEKDPAATAGIRLPGRKLAVRQ